MTASCLGLWRFIPIHAFRRKASSIFLLREAKGNPLGGLSVLSHQPLRGCQRPHPPLCNHRRLFPLAESLTLKDLASCLEALGARHNTGGVPELFLFYISDLVWLCSHFLFIRNSGLEPKMCPQTTAITFSHICVYNQRTLKNKTHQRKRSHSDATLCSLGDGASWECGLNLVSYFYFSLICLGWGHFSLEKSLGFTISFSL